MSQSDAERPGDVPHTSLSAQRRAAIDLIATTRARMIRVQLLSTLLFRPDPDAPEGTQDRERLLAELDDLVVLQERAFELLRGRSDDGRFAPQITNWIGAAANTVPTAVAEFDSMLEVVQNLAAAARENDNQLGLALTAILDFGRTDFFATVTSFCDNLWADLDASREDEIARLAQAGKTLRHTLDRLARIGKHVRLVSINASVEAARAGDAGRGLGVIAVEFKSLAEEIQDDIRNASGSIELLAEYAEDGQGGKSYRS